MGGQPTVGLQIDLPGIARSCGYENVLSVDSPEALDKAVTEAVAAKKLTYIEVKVHKGARKDLGRPTTTPQQNKEALMEFLR